MSSSFADTEDQEAPILHALEANGGFRIYLQNHNFNKPQIMTSYEEVAIALQVLMSTGREKI